MLKRNAPGVHTFLEPIRVRWGTFPHILFIFYGLVSPADSINHRYILTSVLQGTNILLTAQLITGGSSTISALTGMHTYAACCLIPTTVIAYTLVGGLRATFFLRLRPYDLDLRHHTRFHGTFLRLAFRTTESLEIDSCASFSVLHVCDEPKSWLSL